MGDYRLTPDGIQARRASPREMQAISDAEDKLLQVRVPLLLERPGDRVLVVAMDGTGNSIHREAPENFTIVGRLHEGLRAADHPAVATTYVPGIGTQDRTLERWRDILDADSFEQRLEHGYYQLCLQAKRWLEEDPGARIHLVGLGFSRGAEQIPALQRLVHERGIRDPSGAAVGFDDEGLLRHVRYADRPLLVAPGATAQVALLVDPVATSLKEHDRRKPASTVGVLRTMAFNEARRSFEASDLVPDGLSEGGRVATLLLPGSHSDPAGIYQADGIGRRNHNIHVDYINTMLGGQVLQKLPEALDPRLYAIHRSDQHAFGVLPTGHDAETGERRRHADLAPACRTRARPCAGSSADPVLVDTLQWHYVERGPTPGGTDAKMEAAMASIRVRHAQDPSGLDRIVARSSLPGRAEVLGAAQGIRLMFDSLADSARRGDIPGMSAAVEAYLETPAGMAFKPAFGMARTLWDGRHHEPAAAPAMSHP